MDTRTTEKETESPYARRHWKGKVFRQFQHQHMGNREIEAKSTCTESLERKILQRIVTSTHGQQRNRRVDMHRDWKGKVCREL